jgi:hypothetical protein
MTPKEKAKELFDKMCLAMATESTEFGYYTNVIHAKKCALIAVDEILEVCISISDFTDDYEYWKLVKYELEKL